MTILIIVLVVIVIVVVAVFVGGYNGLVRLRNKIDAAWAQIDVQLKRRFDLIPNLVETVKGYAAHEKETFEGVTQARANAISAQSQGPAAAAQADNVLTGALKSLFAVAEAYPDLKANQNFLELAGRADRHRGQGRLRPAVLQRHRAGLQHQDPVDSDQHHRRGLPLREAGVLRG